MSRGAVLVTGGGKRLGREIVLAVARAGWRPVVHYNTSAEEAEEVAARTGGVAIGRDLSVEGAADSLIGEASEALGGRISGLVNSASVFEHDTAQEMTEEALLRNFRINAMAPLLLARHFAAQAPDGGCVVNMLDQKLFNPNADHFSYTVSKAALGHVTQNLAQAFAPKVRVVGVAPGYNLPSPGQDEDKFERLAPTVNILQRRLDPRDVAETVVFALNNKAITGQIILADNGEHLKAATRDVAFAD